MSLFREGLERLKLEVAIRTQSFVRMCLALLATMVYYLDLLLLRLSFDVKVGSCGRGRRENY